MNLQNIDKFYVSPYDEMFHTFDHKHKKSQAQLKEIQKHQRISELRDNKDAKKDSAELWEGF